MTLGNPLRRILLSSIPGTGIDWVRIDGVQHEYSVIANVKEDVIDILLNIKAINLRSVSNRPGKLRLEVEGKGEVCAGDIMASSDFEIVNPELHIATLDNADARLVIEMNVEQGHGYQPASAHKGLPIGVLPVDAIFTPVRKVNFTVERTRVGQHTDYERLVLDVLTDGTISPSEAVRLGAQELVEHFFRFSTVTDSPSDNSDKPSWAAAIPASQYNMAVESLGLSARTLNCLKRASIHKVGEVLERSRSDLLGIRNFGERSLEELDEKLALIGIRHPEIPAADAVEAEVTDEEPADDENDVIDGEDDEE
jgi:DNA-directed RNA polymerase subunit alpha